MWDLFAWIVDALYSIFKGKREAVKLLIQINGEFGMVTLKEGQKVAFTLVALDAKGRPAPVDGEPVWTNSNPGVADLVLNADQMSGEVHYLDGGVAQIKAEVDVRLGADVKLLTALADITCLPMEATVVELQMGVPVDVQPV